MPHPVRGLEVRTLKVLRAVADHQGMVPGGTAVVRRTLRTLVVWLTVSTLVLASGGLAHAAAGGDAAGEDGSGPPLPAALRDGSRTNRTLTRISSVKFSDLDSSDGWAKTAITYVAGTQDWMRDFAANDDGTYPFRPDAFETRRYFARAVVQAFAPDDLPDPSITFTDVDASSSWYRYAAVAVKHGWIQKRADGAFLPNEPVTMSLVHRSLVLALGLRVAAKGLDAIHTRSGQVFDTPKNFGTTVLGMRLFLRYNAPTGSEDMDVAPRDRLTRAQVAYSLFKAVRQPSWNIDDLMAQYTTVELPNLGPKRFALVQWGIRYAGYPYVWGGEWGLESPEPSGLGGQPRSGFDCSGITWWLLRADDDAAWNVAPPRPYAGWRLPERTSAQMAAMTPTRLKYKELRPGDIMLYDGDYDGTVDHVNTYIGNGYALDSSSTPGGVTIMWVGDGWYREHFKWGRQIFS